MSNDNAKLALYLFYEHSTLYNAHNFTPIKMHSGAKAANVAGRNTVLLEISASSVRLPSSVAMLMMFANMFAPVKHPVMRSSSHWSHASERLQASYNHGQK